MANHKIKEDHVKYSWFESRQHGGYAPNTLNPDSSTEELALAIVDETSAIRYSLRDLSDLLEVLRVHLNNTDLDGDALARLTALGLLEDTVIHLIDELRDLHGSIRVLRRHESVIAAASKPGLVASPEAAQFAGVIANMRKRFAEIWSIGKGI